MQQIKQYPGYTILYTPSDEWFFVITPKNNVLYIQIAYFGGYSISFQYTPSRKTGSGCDCVQSNNKFNNAYIGNFSLEDMKILENNGLNYAHKLKAKLYSSPEEWLDSYWKKNTLQKY